MTAIVRSAEYVPFPDGSCYIRVDYEKNSPGRPHQPHTDFIHSVPTGSWSRMQFDRWEDMSYSLFLSALVRKNLEVYRRMARLVHDEFMNKHEKNFMRLDWLARQLTTLDPTFKIGDFNLNCRWQRDLLRDICITHTVGVIATCNNTSRLVAYFNAVSTALKTKRQRPQWQ